MLYPLFQMNKFWNIILEENKQSNYKDGDPEDGLTGL